AAVRRALGLAEDVACELVPSAFDYPTLARLFVPQGFPDPGDRVRHRQAFLALARRLIAAARGRAFLLFTSHEALREAARSLASETAAGRFPWPLLVQGERAHQALLREFRDCGNAVLLGTASFWEGVDVVGPALSLVMIDKLPFAAPADPLRRARTLRIRERGGDPFLELDLPEAVLALKQGAGRLIRSESDRGLLVITDPRLHTAGYRRAFLDSLPPMTGVGSEEEALEFLGTL
ncbi:MAG: helicase C-terminal domain-containing protein, partial [Planctomycetota bacterium]|nr:helicase C-terminal domain-containing protein [Planctomycetota bacterium]